MHPAQETRQPGVNDSPKPASSDSKTDRREETGKRADRQSPNAPPKRKRISKRLIVLLAVYAAWLGWLGYLAWVNIQAGNQ